MYERQNREFEMVIPNMFSDDRYNIRFATIAVLKWRGFSICVSEACLTVTAECGFFYCDQDFFLSLNCPECKTVHKITNAKLFFGKCGWLFFFYLGKTLNWVVLGVFHGDLNFFLSLNYPSLHSGQFRDQKSLNLHEKPL